ncbi:hypothetical protein KI688_002912 [Linnemannia hyalina]|uniref:F-box domain-containing protein n=1 Tax=Linnemannia hyalina TaxID=64524 RepID=A0A9P7XPG9_9FUNG|nr:hypothetical protein KI688_002912 [Linnemannia hyalina]
MLASYQLHPLLLPEILFRVSLAIPAWEPILNENNNNSDDNRFSDSPPPLYHFTPTTLIACSKVCRTWYSIFYPALWTIYDGHTMSPLRSSPSACYSPDESLPTSTTGATESRRRTYFIPDDTILANSDHIQTLLNDHRRLFGRRHYECPRLTDITIYGTSPGLVHLVRSHGSQLRRLKWVGNVPYSGMLEDLDVECLETLTRVEELVLVHNTVVGDSSKGGGGGGRGGGGGVVLEQLEDLAVDAEWAENKALIYFLIGQPSTPTAPSNDNTLTNFCPRLKRLGLGAGLLDDPEMMARLEKVLPLAHPGLVRDMSIIESRLWARYHQTCPQAA